MMVQSILALKQVRISRIAHKSQDGLRAASPSKFLVCHKKHTALTDLKIVGSPTPDDNFIAYGFPILAAILIPERIGYSYDLSQHNQVCLINHLIEGHLAIGAFCLYDNRFPGTQCPCHRICLTQGDKGTDQSTDQNYGPEENLRLQFHLNAPLFEHFTAPVH